MSRPLRNGVFLLLAQLITIAAAVTAAFAADNSKKLSKTDIITICFNAAEVCLDACDKAMLTGAEWNKCTGVCEGARDACVKSAGRSSGATSKDLVRNKKKVNNSLVPN